MAGSFAWGLLAGSSLLLGGIVALRWRIGPRALGLVMAFGSGVLISAVAFDLVQEAVETGSVTDGRRRASSPAVWSSSVATG